MIRYICEWEKNKKKTWSGTSYSLYQALKKEFEVVDDGFYIGKLKKNFLKLINAKLDKKFKICFKRIYNPFLLNEYQKHVNNINYKSENDIIFEVGDLGISKNKYYLYQDLTLDYLLELKEKDPEAYKYSGFQHYEENDLLNRKKYQKKIYENASGIFTMSEFLKKHLIEYSKIPAEKVHCINAGINLDSNYLKETKKSKNKILFVGRDFYRKGGDLVCEAFKILKTNYIPNAELYIIGPSKKELKEYSFEGINILGDLDYEALSYYFNICDIFCLPSRFEAYGIAFIEALIYGLPCIGRNKFAMKEIIKDGENGYLIENNNIDELAKKMNSLLNNDVIHKNVKKMHKHYEREYSWKNVVNKIKKVLENDSNGGKI